MTTCLATMSCHVWPCNVCHRLVTEHEMICVDHIKDIVIHKCLSNDKIEKPCYVVKVQVNE
jgi:hypothetical protein